MSKLLSEKTSKGIIWLGVGLFIIAPFLFAWSTSLFDSKALLDASRTGSMGDFVGGVVGSLWALAGVMLFYVALREQRADFKVNKKVLETQTKSLEQQIEEFKLQRQELENTRQVFELQSITLQEQRFENTLFNLLNLNANIIENLEIHEVWKTERGLADKMNLRGRLAIEEARNHLAYKLVHETRILSEGNDWDYQKEIDKIYREVMEETFRSIFNHYFRNLYHIFRYIHESSLIPDDRKKYYASIVRAQLSNNELYLINLNSIVRDYGNPKFLWLVKHFKIMELFRRNSSFTEKEGYIFQFINTERDGIYHKEWKQVKGMSL